MSGICISSINRCNPIICITSITEKYSLYSRILGLFIASTGLIPYRKYLYQSPVNLSHLVERFSLLTIIIFGEVLVGLTSIFSIEHFNYIYIFQFLIVVSLFGTYWLVTESHINLHQTTIGFQLVYTHLLINVALGILNAAVIFSDSHQLSAILKSV